MHGDHITGFDQLIKLHVFHMILFFYILFQAEDIIVCKSAAPAIQPFGSFFCNVAHTDKSDQFIRQLMRTHRKMICVSNCKTIMTELPVSQRNAP